MHRDLMQTSEQKNYYLYVLHLSWCLEIYSYSEPTLVFMNKLRLIHCLTSFI